MQFLHRLLYLLPWYRRARESEMNEELASLAAIADSGDLGNVTFAAEEARGQWSWAWIENLARDLQYALRALRHNPGFTATAVLSLALGIGANTAIFSLIDALMLRWLPVRDPQQLVQITMRAPKSTTPPNETFSNAIIAGLAEQKDLFSGVCGFSPSQLDAGAPGSITRVSGAWVTGSYYDTLGLTAAAGRLLEPADDRPGAPPVAVLSYGYSQRQFSAAPDAIGRTIRIRGAPVTIVGVSPRGFEGADVGTSADVTMATAALASIEPGMAPALTPGNFWLRALARPQPGITVAQAQSRLAAVWPAMSEHVLNPRWPASRKKELAQSTFELVPGGTGHTFLRNRFRTPLYILMAVTALVLLIACANVASLLLARATARQREISVRLAIGAGRGRIVRQLLTESTLLSLIGASLGILLAWITSRLLVQTLSGGAGNIVFDLAPNWHILAFASAVALANGIIFGLAPAFRTTAIGGSRVVTGDSRGATSSSGWLSSLVAGQVALSLLLLVGAGLFARTLQNLLQVDAGFRREGVLVVDLNGQREGYKGDALRAFYLGLLDRVRRIPGVASASITSHTPLNGSTWSEAAMPKGQPLPERDNATFIAAGAGFFAAMQTPLLAGRDFDQRDQGAPNVAIVNEAYAARYFPNRNPLGESLSATVKTPPVDLQIVGIVKNVHTRNLRAAAPPVVYVPYLQRPAQNDSLVIRAAGPLSQTASAVRRELQSSFPNTAVEAHPLDDQVEGSIVQERLLAKLAGGFGILGLALACVGLYGLLGYTVVRRTREIGIRIALGAQKRGVIWMVARRALGLVSLGVAIGIPAAWFASRWIGTMLFGLKATDPAVIAGAVSTLIAAGMVSAWIPAHRAAKVDPTSALRHE
jgi:predicted permease